MTQTELDEITTAAANSALIELEKHFPELRNLTYSEDSLASINGGTFVKRLTFGIYLELMRAGLLNNIEYK